MRFIKWNSKIGFKGIDLLYVCLNFLENEFKSTFKTNRYIHKTNCVYIFKSFLTRNFVAEKNFYLNSKLF